MSTLYPGARDSIPTQFDNVTTALAAWANNAAAAIMALEQSAQPVVNVKTFQANAAKGDGVTDDTVAINAAEDLLTTNGGTLYFPPGTYMGQGIVKKSNVDWVGAGMGATTIKLKNSASTGVPLVIGQNFASLTGGGTTGGVTNFSIRNLMFDGNQSNNLTYATFLLQWYAFGFQIDRIGIHDCKLDAWYSEWGPSGAIISPAGLEAKVTNFWIGFCGRDGIVWNGPHDSIFSNGTIEGCARHSVWTQTNGNACVFSQVHCWGGSQDWSWYLDTNAYLLGCQGEDGTVGAVWCRGSGTQIIGGQYFSTPVGFRIGVAAGPAVQDTFISGAAVLGLSTACIDFANDNGGNLIEFYTTGGNTMVAQGTQSANTLIIVANTGAGGAPGSPYTFWPNGSPIAIRDGSANGPQILLRHGGAGLPNKTIQNLSGVLRVLNSAGSTAIWTLDDVGNMTLAAGGHLLNTGTAPTAAAGANAGTGPPAPVVAASSTDVRGSLTFGTGTVPAAGAMVGVTFHTAFAAAPFVVLTWLNAAGAGLGQAYATAVGTGGFTIDCTVAPAASQANTVYAVAWHVVG